jgi:mono/diheme cytochrome c family protein
MTMHNPRCWIVLALFAFGAACQTGRNSASGFRLPPDRDAHRGMVAFAMHGCTECHTVSGVALPQPEKPPVQPIVLGGKVHTPISDGYLFTSIAYPDYRLASYPRDRITVNGHSRMPHYTERMTVQELADIVEFLQANYRLTEMPPYPAYF